MEYTPPNALRPAQLTPKDTFHPDWLFDQTEAERFLKLLDSDTSGFILSSFDDDKERDRRRRAGLEKGVLPEQRYGAITKMGPWIAHRHQLGANVCCTVQAMKRQHRLADDVSYIRTIFGEFDEAPRKNFPLEPSIIVESSPGHQHIYWLTDPEHPLPIDGFDGVQKRIVLDYGADANAKDLARTLRLPGTWNLKPGREPHQVKIIYEAGARYTRDELLGAFPPGPKEKLRAGPRPKFERFRGKGDLRRFVDPLKHISADDYWLWLGVGMALHHESAGDAEGLRTWDAWSAQSSKWLRGECDYRWQTFRTGKGITGGTVYEIAKDCGYRKPEPRTDWRTSTLRSVPASTPSFDNRPAEPVEQSELVEPVNQQPDPDAWLPAGFRRMADRALEFLAGQNRDGEDDWQWLSSPIEIVAETSDVRDREHGRLIRTFDRQNNRWHEWAMPMRLLAGDPGAYRSELLSMGARLGFSRKAKDALGGLIQNATPARKLRCVGRTGWHCSTFVLPDRTIGDEDDRGVVFQSNRPCPAKFRTSGTLEEWKNHIAALAAGNSRLMIGIMAAFAGPSLRLAKQEGGGLHIHGDSSGGKTTTLRVAGSVWGGGGINGFLENWTATTNGLEGRARVHSDTLLCLQELGQADPDAAADAAYKLANGSGKGRMGADAELRETAEWRVLFLSDGEITLDDKIRESRRGGRRMAGQAVRVIDIPADAGAGFGAFDHIDNCASGREFCEKLLRATEQHYGTAALAYLERLTSDIPGATETLKSSIDQFVRDHAHDCGGQVERVAKRFGLLAACGELAVKWGILPWKPGSATDAAKRCFLEWLAIRGTHGPSEIEQGIQQVRRAIERDGASRFVPWLEPHKPVINRLGFVQQCQPNDPGGEGQIFYVLPEGWKEICSGFNAGNIAKALKDRGILLAGKDGKATDKPRLPGMGPRRCYVIDARKLFEDGGQGGQGGRDE